jgi:hypothetical protein
MKLFRRCGEEAVEQVGAVGLVVVGGVVALALQGGSELDAGLEEGAGFADGFEGAVQFGWSGAVAVAEEAVVFSAESVHPRPGEVGGKDATDVKNRPETGISR